MLGLLDDALLLPLGITLALRLIPAPVMAEACERAETLDREKRPTSMAGAVVIVLLWLVVVALAGRAVWHRVSAA